MAGRAVMPGQASLLPALLLSLLVLPVLGGCDKPPPAPTVAAADAPLFATVPNEPITSRGLAACRLVTGEEMSAIVGAALRSETTGRSGETECIYRAAAGSAVTVRLSVDRGDGQAAMAGARFAARSEPGLADPLAGIGDQAVVAGHLLLVRVGKDLLTIVFSGVDDGPSKARQIVDTARARM